jgi:dolichyl-diphosphooligosaccharide--protein glycosyltransferase
LKKVLGRYINRETLASRIEAIQKNLSKISRGTLLQIIVLAIALGIAVTLRIMPIRWGAYLSEYDPYFQYRLTQRILSQGFKSYFTWHDSLSWYPYGRNIVISSYPGLAITAAVLYSLISGLGVGIDLYDFTVIFPVIFGAITVLIIYVFLRDFWGKDVALLSALFLAFSSSHISRTSIGFFDDETIGIFAMLLFFTFFLRATTPGRSIRSVLIYSTLSGLSLSYLTLSWGAFRYPMSLGVLYTAILVLLGRYDRNLLLGYSASYGLQLAISSQLPYLGYTYLTEWSTLTIPAVFFLLLVAEIFHSVRSTRGRLLAIGGVGALALAGFLALWQQGLISSLDLKFTSVINPIQRLELPLIESVAEHRPATWASFFYLILLGVFGLILLIQRGRSSDIFLVLYGLTSMYFSASLIRLTLILAPAMAALSAVGTVELAKPSIDILREAIIYPKRRIRAVMRVGREFGVAILLVLIITILPTFSRAMMSAQMPVTIATSGIGIIPQTGQEQKYQDWLEALAWMKQNLPEDAVIFSWWDYGYWISAIGGRHSLADNGTINGTQIALIAQTFLLNETMAVPNLKKLHATHIAVFVTFQQSQGSTPTLLGYGEEGKWPWMARIGNGTKYGEDLVFFLERRVGDQREYFRTIMREGKTIANETITEGNMVSDATLLGLLTREARGSEQAESDYFRLVFSSSNKFVLLYEIVYPTPSHLMIQLSKMNVTYGEAVQVTGNLTDGSGNPIAGETVTVEYSKDGGTTWISIDNVKTRDDGSFIYEWTPDAGRYLVRVSWGGVAGKYLKAASQARTLIVSKIKTDLTLKLSSNSITLGGNVTVTATMSPIIPSANITIQFRVGNGSWTTAGRFSVVNGSAHYIFSPRKEGVYEIRAVYEGSINYEPATSPAATLTVTKEE